MHADTRITRLLLLVVCVAGWLALAGPRSAEAVTEPQIVNPSWSLTLTYRLPQAVAVVDADGVTRWFWYLPYKVTNHTGEDRLFVPEVVVYKDNGEIVAAGKDVPPKVFDRVKYLLKNPLLVDSVEVVGKLLRGDDFARESVAIWPVSEDDVDSFTVFIGGLHGETAKVTDPRTGEVLVDPVTGEPVVLRRTLMLQFDVPGNFRTPQEQPVVLVDERDVMR